LSCAETEIYHNVRHHTASEIYICGKFYIWLLYLASTVNFYFGVLLPGREIYFLALHIHVQCNICQICNRLEATTTKLYETFVYIHHRICWIHLYWIWLLRLQDTLGTRVRRSTICWPVKKQFASDNACRRNEIIDRLSLPPTNFCGHYLINSNNSSKYEHWTDDYNDVYLTIAGLNVCESETRFSQVSNTYHQ
jgi:hypothetical protein